MVSEPKSLVKAPKWSDLSAEERLDVISYETIRKISELSPAVKKPDKWLVDGFIGKGTYNLLLGRPHRGKSFVAEQLAICVSSGMPFLFQFPLVQSKVILIDEDTPTDILMERLYRFGNCAGKPIEHLPLEIHSMEGFCLDVEADLTKLIDIINVSSMQAPSKVLVILDCLGSMVSKYNTDKTSDARQIGRAIRRLKSTNATIFVVHHMTLKGDEDEKIFTQDGDFTRLSMGNTALISDSDTVFGMWKTSAKDKTTFVFKPKPRRIQLSLPNTFGIEFLEGGDKEYSWCWLKYILDLPLAPSEDAELIVHLFQDFPDMWFSLQEVLVRTGKILSEQDTRRALKELTNSGVIELSRTGHNRFNYRLGTMKMASKAGRWLAEGHPL